jgi:hypothetical protein
MALAKPNQLAPTVELDASYNGHSMFAYMVPGMCGLRSFYGFDNAPAKDVLLGMIYSGISGSVMIFTTTLGVEKANEFKNLVESEGLGNVTVSQGVANKYTGTTIYTILFEYNTNTLVDWARKQTSKDVRGPDWHTGTDKVHMDSWFYSGGGRPLSKEKVEQRTKYGY